MLHFVWPNTCVNTDKILLILSCRQPQLSDLAGYPVSYPDSKEAP
jgi:hypothetical protein